MAHPGPTPRARVLPHAPLLRHPPHGSCKQPGFATWRLRACLPNTAALSCSGQTTDTLHGSGMRAYANFQRCAPAGAILHRTNGTQTCKCIRFTTNALINTVAYMQKTLKLVNGTRLGHDATKSVGQIPRHHLEVRRQKALGTSTGQTRARASDCCDGCGSPTN